MRKNGCIRTTLLSCTIAILNAFGGIFAIAQGQDSTPAERDIMILGSLLPGEYNNANQAYFDVRLKQPDEKRHPSMHSSVRKIDAPEFGDYAFSNELSIARDPKDPTHYLYSFEVDNAVEAVRMKSYTLDKAPKNKPRKSGAKYMEGCDLLWKQEAGQFHGKLESDTCQIAEKDTAYDMLLTPDAFWINSSSDAISHSAMDRARNFTCYVDVPGVGGGRDTPYKRYDFGEIHDMGGISWITTDDGQEIGVSLFRVMWAFNTYTNAFTRPSFVIYLKTKLENGDVKDNGYAFTIPDAQRIGINLKWALANCYMLSNEEIEPFYKTDEPKK